MQILGWSAMPAWLASTGGDRLAGAAPVFSIAINLSRDGADRTFKPLGNLRARLLLVQQGSDGHSFFRRRMLTASKWGVVNRYTLLDL